MYACLYIFDPQRIFDILCGSRIKSFRIRLNNKKFFIRKVQILYT